MTNVSMNILISPIVTLVTATRLDLSTIFVTKPLEFALAGPDLSGINVIAVTLFTRVTNASLA